MAKLVLLTCLEAKDQTTLSLLVSLSLFLNTLNDMEPGIHVHWSLTVIPEHLIQLAEQTVSQSNCMV